MQITQTRRAMTPIGMSEILFIIWYFNFPTCYFFHGPTITVCISHNPTLDIIFPSYGPMLGLNIHNITC